MVFGRTTRASTGRGELSSWSAAGCRRSPGHPASRSPPRRLHGRRVALGRGCLSSTVLLGVLGIVLVPREAAAQVCRASLRFDRDSHLQLGGSAGLLHGSTLKTGSTAQFLGAIGDKDLYARVGIGRNRYSDYGFSTTDFNVAVGTQIQVSERHGIVACPEADLDIETNDSLGGPNVSLSSRTHSGGVSFRIGAERRLGSMEASAFIGGGWLRSLHTVLGNSLVGGPEDSIANAGFLEIGAGALFKRRAIVTPAFRVPVGVSHGIQQFSVTVLFGF
jgi:hypothetical protein